MYLNNIATSCAVVYRGREGLRVKIHFTNLHTKGSSPNDVPILGLRMEGSNDLAVLAEE